jgi:hypothetical protein
MFKGRSSSAFAFSAASAAAGKWARNTEQATNRETACNAEIPL